MKPNSPRFLKLLRIAFMVVVILFGIEGYSQTISTPVVSGTPVCAGSTVTVSFVVTNGMGKENGGGAQKFFTTSTNYTLEFYDNGTLIPEATLIFTSSTAPESTGGATTTIVQDFTIPYDQNFGQQYQVKVSSENPSPRGNTDLHFSTAFEVHALITNNIINTAQSGCNPYDSEIVIGTVPAGGDKNFSFLWESSTTSPSAGFSPAPGTNNSQDYDPGTLTQTTWFRRVVISGACTDDSNVVEINITNDNTWMGALDNDWNTPGNWSCNAVPIPVTNVIIPQTGTAPVLETGNPGTANNITIGAGAQLTITTNTLELGGNISNNGTFDTQNGSLTFVGTATQNLPTNCFLNNRIANLTVDNSTGLTLNGPLEVTGTVLAESGNLSSFGNLKLISDPTQTALIDGSGGGQVLGNVTMQRYLDNAFGYKYFAAPFSNSKVGDFTDIDLDETFPNFYRYDESRKVNINDTLRDATGWEAYIDPAAPLNVMEGYALNFGATTNALTVSLTGEVNNGVYSAELKNNNGEYTKGFHLVGNPYPSPIDWDAATGWTKTNIDDQIHFFTAGTENRYTGTYESYVNGVAQNGGSATSIIPSMQAFFIKVSDSDTDNYPVSGTLGISNAVRVNNFTQQFYRNGEPAPKSLIRLNAAFEGKGSKDGMVIYFENQASQDFESELDAHKLINTDANVPNLYSLSPDRQQLSINAVARPEEKDATIPLGITTERGGTMSISLQDLENLPYDFAVFLKDEEKNKTVDLRKQAYSFEVKKGKTNSRFELLFSNESNLINEDFGDEFFSVFSSDGQMQVDLNLDEKEEGFLSLSTVTGQLLETKAGRGKEQVNFEGIGSSGVYFVILEKDGKRYTKKVLIRK